MMGSGRTHSTNEGGVREMTPMPDLNEFLARLNARRERLTFLAERGRVLDAEDLVDEVDELGEQLIKADEQLRTQQAELDDARRALEIVAARNDELFEASAAAYVLTDRAGVLLSANRRAAALIADTPARRAIRPFSTRFAVADRPGIRSLINHAGSGVAESGSVFAGEGALLRPDGITLQVDIAVRADRDPDTGSSTLLWELTPRPRLEVMHDAEAVVPRLQAAGAPRADATPTELLDNVVEMAVSIVPGAEHASILLLRAGQPIETPAASSDLAAEWDRVQYEVGDGPGWHAVVGDRGVVVIREMRNERRWRRFAERAAGLGVRSLLACHLPTPRGTLGSLNLYSAEPDAFDSDSVLIGRVVATRAAIALALADQERELQRAIDRSELIGQAIQALMARDCVTASSAFETLVEDSASSEVTISEQAQRLVDAEAIGDVGPEPLTIDG
jgi:PAS domain-containing protein